MKYLLVCAIGAIVMSPVAFGQTLSCPDLSAPIPSKASKEFVEAFNASSVALSVGRYGDAVAMADLAAPNAIDALQLQSALKVRSAALAASHDDMQLVPTLEMRIKVGCHLISGEAGAIEAQLAAARARLGAQRP